MCMIHTCMYTQYYNVFKHSSYLHGHNKFDMFNSVYGFCAIVFDIHLSIFKHMEPLKNPLHLFVERKVTKIVHFSFSEFD